MPVLRARSGAVADDRADKLLSGSAIGSKRIARRVTAKGGAAVIHNRRDLAHAGSAAFVAGNGPDGIGIGIGIGIGNAFSGAEQRTATRFIVIRYLDN